MRALKCLARGERVKLKDLKLEKKIISKLFSDNPNIKSFNVDVYKDPITGEHTLVDYFTLMDGVEEDAFIKMHHLVSRQVSFDIVKRRGLEFAKLLEKDIAGLATKKDRVNCLKKVESRINRIIISLVDAETPYEWECRKFNFIQDKFYDVVSYLSDIKFPENKYVLSYNLPNRFLTVIDEAYEVLVKAELLAKNSKVAFNSVLIHKNKTQLLDWIGFQNILVYFIREITSKEHNIIYYKGDKWDVAANCFTVMGRRVTKAIQNDNPPKDSNPGKIAVDQVIKLFKKKNQK
jgi:hypothetical protein